MRMLTCTYQYILLRCAGGESGLTLAVLRFIFEFAEQYKSAELLIQLSISWYSTTVRWPATSVTIYSITVMYC